MKTFNEVNNSAETGKKAAVRALQAWQFLISKATNRQLVRYGDLAAMMGYEDNRPLTQILGHIMHLCGDEHVPPLTIVVVNQDGTPGPGFTEVSREEFDRKREEVFGYDWFGLVPPTIAEFQAAHDRHKAAA
jgi:putative restriction endonuclease